MPFGASTIVTSAAGDFTARSRRDLYCPTSPLLTATSTVTFIVASKLLLLSVLPTNRPVGRAFEHDPSPLNQQPGTEFQRSRQGPSPPLARKSMGCLRQEQSRFRPALHGLFDSCVGPLGRRLPATLTAELTSGL